MCKKPRMRWDRNLTLNEPEHYLYATAAAGHRFHYSSFEQPAHSQTRELQQVRIRSVVHFTILTPLVISITSSFCVMTLVYTWRSIRGLNPFLVDLLPLRCSLCVMRFVVKLSPFVTRSWHDFCLNEFQFSPKIPLPGLKYYWTSCQETLPTLWQLCKIDILSVRLRQGIPCSKQYLCIYSCVKYLFRKSLAACLNLQHSCRRIRILCLFTYSFHFAFLQLI